MAAAERFCCKPRSGIPVGEWVLLAGERWGVAYAHWSPAVTGLEVAPCASRASARALLADLVEALPGV